jgi:hypothetical protein
MKWAEWMQGTYVLDNNLAISTVSGYVCVSESDCLPLYSDISLLCWSEFIFVSEWYGVYLQMFVL